jgi:hypothetical protein
MIELLLFTFVAYGMTTILVYGSIFNGVRDFIHQQAQDENGFILTRPIFKFLGIFELVVSVFNILATGVRLTPEFVVE